MTYTPTVGSTFAGSSQSTIQTVNKARATTTVTCSPNPSIVGQLVTCTAAVSATAPGAGQPTGTVRFIFDGGTGSPVTIGASGNASFSTSTLSLGSHTLRVAFSGDGNFLASSATITQVVNPVPVATTTTLTCNHGVQVPNSGTAATATTSCTATVRSGGATPTGAVQFLQNGVALGGPVTLNTSGVATLSARTLAGTGAVALTAAYPGAAGFSPSTSAAFSVRIDHQPVAPHLGTYDVGAGATLCVGRASWPGGTGCFAGIQTGQNSLALSTDSDGGALQVHLVQISFASGEWSGFNSDGSFTYSNGRNTQVEPAEDDHVLRDRLGRSRSTNRPSPSPLARTRLRTTSAPGRWLPVASSASGRTPCQQGGEPAPR